MKNASSKKYTLTTIFVFLFFFVGISWFVADRLGFVREKEKTLEINDAVFTVEIADTPGKQIKGLSDRDHLDENKGMLFVFSEPAYYPFWMKDMLIPLDFIWIKGDKVVDVNQNIRPEDYPPPKYFTPKYPADSVLEVNAGTVAKFNIKVGDKVSF